MHSSLKTRIFFLTQTATFSKPVKQKKCKKAKNKLLTVINIESPDAISFNFHSNLTRMILFIEETGAKSHL